MKLITSADNPAYKAAVQLKQKKYRDEQGQYLIEGPNLIREATENGGQIQRIFFSQDAEAGSPDNLPWAELKTDAPAVILPIGLFRKLSDTETPQGVMAVVKKRIYEENEFFSFPMEEAYGREGASNIIVLDRLQDPGNIGTILRTADAAGYLGAVLIRGTADIYSPKIVRAAAGSLFRLPVLTAASPEEAISLLRRNGKRIICTSPAYGSFYYDADLRKDVAVVIGNEGNGVADEFLNLSDTLVKIPMNGTIESLNAAMSAGILMYESVRQQYSG